MKLRFRRQPAVIDINEVKKVAAKDNIEFKDPDLWQSSYQNSFVEHPTEQFSRKTGSGSNIDFGRSGYKDEETSYSRSWKPFDVTEIPKVEPVKQKRDIFLGNEEGPKSTSMKDGLLSEGDFLESIPKLPISANDYGRAQRTKHFDIGYSSQFEKKKEVNRGFNSAREKVEIDRKKLSGSSIVFGMPETARERIRKQDSIPEPKEFIQMNQKKANFDVGHDKRDWTTTTRASYSGSLKHAPVFKTPKGQQCATLCDDGVSESNWSTAYQEQFFEKRMVKNVIDEEDIKRSHWEPGLTPADWPQQKAAPVIGKPEIVKNSMESNQVFKGDGAMRCKTTNDDLIVKHDNVPQVAECKENRGDHIVMGSDSIEYISSARDANRMAGKKFVPREKPVRPGGRQRSSIIFGDYRDRNEQQRHVQGKPAQRTLDGKYFYRAHFDVGSEDQNEQLSSVYYKTICEPVLPA